MVRVEEVWAEPGLWAGLGWAGRPRVDLAPPANRPTLRYFPGNLGLSWAVSWVSGALGGMVALYFSFSPLVRAGNWRSWWIPQRPAPLSSACTPSSQAGWSNRREPVEPSKDFFIIFFSPSLSLPFSFLDRRTTCVVAC